MITLADILSAQRPEITKVGPTERHGIVHRLDRDTSGLLIIAKKRSALVNLQEQIRHGDVKKYYLTLTNGNWKDDMRNVKAPLYKYVTKSGERRVRVDNELGRYSNTIFRVLERYKDYTLVEAELKTGRTHQIRVHLLSLGTPIVGDDKYGDYEVNNHIAKYGLKRMFLHAQKMSFIHPITGNRVEFIADLPKELVNFLDSINDA